MQEPVGGILVILHQSVDVGHVTAVELAVEIAVDLDFLAVGACRVPTAWRRCLNRRPRAPGAGACARHGHLGHDPFRRNLDHAGDLVVGKVFERDQDQQLAVRLVQPVDRPRELVDLELIGAGKIAAKGGLEGPSRSPASAAASTRHPACPAGARMSSVNQSQAEIGSRLQKLRGGERRLDGRSAPDGRPPARRRSVSRRNGRRRGRLAA